MKPKTKLILTIQSIIIFIFCLSVACGTVRLIAEYDETIDKGITDLNRKTEAFLTNLEKTYIKYENAKDDKLIKELKEKLSYEESEDFYTDFRVELRVLKLRAECFTKNEKTVQQFEKMEEILNEQEKIHKNGFQDVIDIEAMSSAFNRGFKGILKLEIAKRRGKEKGK